MGKSGTVHGNENPEVSHSGLNPSGEMRIGDKITIAISGDKIELRDGPRVKTVPENEFEGFIREKWFGEY